MASKRLTSSCERLREDPLDSRPERFWESEKDVRGRDFELLPFGCWSKNFPFGYQDDSRSSLINTFHWKLHGGISPNELNMEEKFGITLAKTQSLLAVPILL